MAKKYKIAVAQVEMLQNPFRLKYKLEFTKNLIYEAAQKQAQIICFPEAYTSILNFDSIQIINNFLSSSCRKNNIWAIFGGIIKEDDKRYNGAFLINRSGKIVGKYKKQHLMIPEKRFSCQGNCPGIFETDFGKIGIIICFDMFSANVISQYQNEDLDVIFCPSLMVVPYTEYIKEQEEIVTRILPQSICVQCNAYFALSMMSGNNLIAESAIYSPFGREFWDSENKKEGLVIGEIDPAKLEILNTL